MSVDNLNLAKRTATRKAQAIDRFWRTTNITESCWFWTGLVDKNGYGRIRPGTGTAYMRAHRFSWLIHNGPIPEGSFVLHTCDVPCCVNPQHLFLGTNMDNVNDMIAKGRILTGDKHGMRKKALAKRKPIPVPE